MAVALYARKSVERENSISCETQLDYCRAMLTPDEQKERFGSSLTTVFPVEISTVPAFVR